MSDLPKSVTINEEGPREGFQIEKGPIPTARKIELIEALSETGLKHIQVVSFVNPKRVPGMADAEDVVRGFSPKPGIDYTGLWLNEKGLERARATGKLTLKGKISIYASEKFSMKNNNRTTAQEFEYARRVLDNYKENGIPVDRGSVAAAFGCNYQGDILVQTILGIVRRIYELAEEHAIELKELSFADTMAWA
ncbi:MAG TPA: hydroxymethylglutaryl-CoA lyase, partial [Burkholderiales bacterium]